MDELRVFCRSVGLAETPDFAEIDPVLTARIYESLEQIAADPGDASVYARLGDLYQRHDFFAAARSAYEVALSIDDRYAFHYLLAHVELTDGRIEQAIHHLRRTLELNPGYSAAQYHLAEQLFNNGDLDEAAEVYRRLADSENGASGHLGLALIAQSRNDPEQARDHLIEALRLDPDNYRAHYQLALYYRQRGEAELYEEHFGKYQSLPHRIKLEDPLLTEVMLASVTPVLVREVVDDLNSQGREREALAFLGDAIRRRPRHPMLLRLLAITQARLKQLDQAFETIESCLRIDGEDVVALTVKSRICLALHRWTDAMDAAQRAIDVDPSRAESYFLRGQAYRGQGLAAEAIASYETASNTDPDNFLLAVAWAESLFARQRYDEAEAAYRRADRARAGDSRIRDRLEQIARLRHASKHGGGTAASTSPAPTR